MEELKKHLKRDLIILGSLPVIIFLYITAQDIISRQEFQIAKNTLSTIARETIESAGGIKQDGRELGNGWSDSWNCFPSLSCPLAEGVWLTPLELDKADDFAAEIRDKAGFKETGPGTAKKGQLNLYVSISPSNANGPYELPSDKMWWVVRVKISY